MKRTMLVILAMTSTVALSAPRTWIYIEESNGEVWLLNANDIRPAPGWGGDYSHSGAVLVSTVHVKVSSFPRFNRQMQQQYDGAAQLKIATGWVPFQSVFGGPHQLDDPKRIAYIELLADTNFLDLGNPANHEWVAVDCSTGDIGVTDVTRTESTPTYHPATGMYSGSTSLASKNVWIPAANVPPKYRPLVDFICNRKMHEYEGAP